jgi:hypothetical protein
VTVFPRACLYPGCPELVDPGATNGYCDRHAGTVRSRPTRRTPQTRGRPWSRNRWREASKARRARHPTCEACQRRPSQLTHHLIPAREQLLPGRDHLAAVCASCHQLIERALRRGEVMTSIDDLCRVVQRDARHRRVR